LIIMTITGAVYPAIDLTAGERERGTLESLMAAPVPRMGLRVAKYVAVVTVAINPVEAGEGRCSSGSTLNVQRSTFNVQLPTFNVERWTLDVHPVPPCLTSSPKPSAAT
jgi:hypothetical protein